MLCRKITLCDFRNIKEATVPFCSGVNLLYGDNAQGKTNLIEAVYFAAIGKSFRGQSGADVIRFGCESAALSLDFSARGREHTIAIRYFRDRARSVEKNRVKITKMSELIGSFRAVLFSPEHLSLVRGGPAERRQFLDIAISAADPLYLSSLQRFSHVLKQRNALLKEARHDKETFEKTVFIWSRQLAAESAYLARARARYLEKAKPFVARCFADMTSGKETPSLSYLGLEKGNHDYEDISGVEEKLYFLLTENLEREVAAGATLYGAHRDDVGILLNGKPARLFASQGQQRSLSIALKIAEGELCREECGEYPVFLFDDVLSELDSARREYLFSEMRGKQLLMTSCEGAMPKASSCILVRDGEFFPQ